MQLSAFPCLSFRSTELSIEGGVSLSTVGLGFRCVGLGLRLGGCTAQVAASSEVSVVAVEDVAPEVVQKETDIEMGKEDILKKPENIRCRQLPLSAQRACMQRL